MKRLKLRVIYPASLTLLLGVGQSMTPDWVSAKSTDIQSRNAIAKPAQFNEGCFRFADKKKTILTRYRCPEQKSPVIPNGVTVIGEFAFSDNKLTSVKISNSVTSIGKEAFCDNQLTSVKIPDGVTVIGAGAFFNNKLTSVAIPNSVTSIGKFAFFKNQLKSVVVPNSVRDLAGNAFDPGTQILRK